MREVFRFFVGQAKRKGKLFGRVGGNLTAGQKGADAQQGALVHVEIGIERIELDEGGKDGVVGDHVVVGVHIAPADPAAEGRPDDAVIDVLLSGLRALPWRGR